MSSTLLEVELSVTLKLVADVKFSDLGCRGRLVRIVWEERTANAWRSVSAMDRRVSNRAKAANTKGMELTTEMIHAIGAENFLARSGTNTDELDDSEYATLLLRVHAACSAALPKAEFRGLDIASAPARSEILTV